MSRAEIPWVRLAAEGGAVVLSILIAFAIDAWWDGAQQRRHVGDVLVRLEAGLVESQSLIEVNIARVTSDLGGLRRFMTMTPDDAMDVPPDSAFSLLEPIWRPNTADNNASLLESILEDETLKLLDDDPLQEAIVRWREVLAEVRERNELMALGESEALAVLGRHEGVGKMMADFRWGRPDPRSAQRDLIRVIRQDGDVVAMITRKLLQAEVQLHWLQSLDSLSDSLLNLVRRAQEE